MNTQGDKIKYICACVMKSGKREAQIVKADYGCVNLKT